MNNKKSNLKKIIIYRLTYSGMKETDILYQRLFLNKLESLNFEELNLLALMFIDLSDSDIMNMITKKYLKLKNIKI